MNPWILIGLAIALLTAYLGGRYDGTRLTEAKHNAAQLEAREAQTAALQAAAEAVVKLDIKHITNTRIVEGKIHEVPVYRDCKHDPDVMRALNNLLADRAEPADKGGVPKDAGGIGGGRLRRDDKNAGEGDSAVP